MTASVRRPNGGPEPARPPSKSATESTPIKSNPNHNPDPSKQQREREREIYLP